MAAQIADGDLVLIVGRVRMGYEPNGLATVRFITSGSEGGAGFQQIVLPPNAIYCRLDDERHGEHAPPISWR
jgi:hypothetical protein